MAAFETKKSYQILSILQNATKQLGFYLCTPNQLEHHRFVLAHGYLLHKRPATLTNMPLIDEKLGVMIACCDDGTRSVIFKIERIGIPEKDEEETWLQKQNLTNATDNAYTG